MQGYLYYTPQLVTRWRIGNMQGALPLKTNLWDAMAADQAIQVPDQVSAGPSSIWLH